MKKTAFLILLLIISIVSFCQQMYSSADLNSTDYLNKSKMQTTTATVLISTGGLLTTIGIIERSRGFTKGFGFSNSNSGFLEMNTGNMLMITGGALMLVSVPLFISSVQKKKMAMTISANIKKEKRQIIKNCSLAQNSFPVLSIKLSFR